MGKCSKHEVIYALRLILSPQIASNSVKACLRAGAMYNISSDLSRQVTAATWQRRSYNNNK